MKLIGRTAATAAVLFTITGCGAMSTGSDESNSDNTLPAAAAFADVSSTGTSGANAEPAVQVGNASITEAGPGQAAIDFVSTELFSGNDVDGHELFGSGSVITTFVQPGCDFSVEHAEVIDAAVSAHDDVTFVFVHSGAAPESFVRFAEEAGLDDDNVVHLNDHSGELSYRFGIAEYPTTLLADAGGQLSITPGALDSDRMAQAVSLVEA